MGKKKEPTEQAAVEEEIDAAAPAESKPAKEAPKETAAAEPEPKAAAEAKSAEPEVQDAEPDSYTLTAEEFQAAKTHIEALQKEKDETVQLLQRIQADFDNFRRRNASVRLDSYEEGKRDCIKELLPILDNFERAMEHAAASDENWREGIALVRRQFSDSLKKLGLEEIEADGKFDPNLHEAIAREKTEGRESGEILQVLQKGYRVGDRILRHSIVKVTE